MRKETSKRAISTVVKEILRWTKAAKMKMSLKTRASVSLIQTSPRKSKRRFSRRVSGVPGPKQLPT